MLREIGRRAFLWLLGASGVSVAFGGLWGCRTPAERPLVTILKFLSPAEWRTLEALADALIPEDETVGAVSAGAVLYIDRFLAAFDAPVPDLFRAGPFSDRNPYPDPRTGRSGNRHPDNGFLEVLPPTRLQILAFRKLLDGPEGLRALYREGIAALGAAAAGSDFASLDDAARLAAFDAAPRAFQEAVLSHLAEGMFCPPEYGGNRDGIAWRDYHYGGDSQPLGYTLWDRENQRLYDRPDRPNQVLDPALPNAGFEPEMLQLLERMVTSQGGKRYF